MIRVLTGKGHQKYTVTIFHADGRETEFQSMSTPNTVWNEAHRCMWIGVSDYPKPSYSIMPWKEGDVIHVEQNPDWKE
jgi:hypothetical protein